MILLPGQSANATVKRDASNNVVYGTTGTDNTIDKIVYARGISANVNNAQSQTTYGGYSVSCPAAIARTFTNAYGSVTFPAVANGYEVGWTGYALLSSGGDDWYGTSSFESIQGWSSRMSWASAYVMYYFFQTVAFSNAYMNNANLYFTLLAGAGGVAGKAGGVGSNSCIISGVAAPTPAEKTITTTSATPAAPLTTTQINNVSSSVVSGGSAWWSDTNRARNLTIQVAYAPAENMTTPPMITTGDFAVMYDYIAGGYYNPNNVSIFTTGAHAFPGFIMRCVYTNTPNQNVYATRTYSGSISHERTNSDGSKFIESASWNNPSTSPINVALTQTS